MSTTKSRNHKRSLSPRGAGPRDGPVRLFGIHAVEAALNNPARHVAALRLTDNAARKLGDALQVRGITHERVRPRDLDKLLGPDTVHQGAMLETALLDETRLEDICEAAFETKLPVVALDQVTDPHNVGAILRSMAAFGSSGLIMTRRHSAPLDGTLAKSASGALERVPIHLCQNLANTLGDLRSSGIAVVGLDGEADDAIELERFDAPSAVVLGAEGKGLREKTKQTCDRLARISAHGVHRSLNVSIAAAVTLHAALVARSRV